MLIEYKVPEEKYSWKGKNCHCFNLVVGGYLVKWRILDDFTRTQKLF